MTSIEPTHVPVHERIRTSFNNLPKKIRIVSTFQGIHQLQGTTAASQAEASCVGQMPITPLTYFQN